MPHSLTSSSSLGMRMEGYWLASTSDVAATRHEASMRRKGVACPALLPSFL